MDDRVTRIRNLIADEPLRPDDAGGLLHRVCAVAAHTLAASGAWISVMTHVGGRGMYAASDPTAEHLEQLQFTLGEGPCWDAFASRRPVLVPDLDDGAAARWPMYTPAVHDSGIRAVCSFPMQMGSTPLGVLDVFRRRTGALTGDELSNAGTFAEVTVTALLDHHEHATSNGLGDGLAEAGEYRAEVAQAQGMVMVQLGGSLADALIRMRAYAFAHGRRLDEVAHDVLARQLRFDRDSP